jgi:hypothetical protein
VKDITPLQVSAPGSAVIPAQCQPLACWPDGSLRWACIETILPSSISPEDGLTLHEGGSQNETTALIERSDDQIRIGYTDCQLTVSPDSLEWQWSGPDQQSFLSRLSLYDEKDKICSATLDHPWQIKRNGPVVTVLAAKGWWYNSQTEKLARFHCELNLYANGLVTTEATIHNPRRARHPGGLWDLGDPGSLHFGGMVLETEVHKSERYRLSLSADQPPREFSAQQPLSLHQESSGGENWNSRNHINAQGQVLPRYRGYRLQRGQHEPEEGLRAEPIIEARTRDSVISVSLPRFWQNFPSALEADDTAIRAWLFPANKPEAYELQGGERKTQRVILGYGLTQEHIHWSQAPLVPVLSAEHYEAAQAFPWFTATNRDDKLQSLIQSGIDGPHNFFHKREIIDEYGWRNFGELFADHETLYQPPGEAPFISHYNNQYDPIYGFARQFALTGEPRWQELMGDLAHHVTDIDIYHTDEDRVEYNNGLFWHTDHYLDAHTATHRTFSRHNTTSSTPGQTGGGPGAEHCYTSGLLYDYWMTGNQQSADAVLELAQWLENSFEHPGGLLGQMLALKKQELPRLKALLRGQAPLAHRYPFTRATGNYLNALLDAWLLTGDRHWLNRAETVIRHSIHPNDDPAQRNLLDVETGWSYLVLLTSITKYLWTKEQQGESDSHYAYARHALARYTRWMQQNERPFLQQTEQLEFPNHTWTAQDLRKAMLLYLARYTDPDQASAYQEQADAWLQQSLDTLQQSPEAHYTRLLVILMQNQGPQMLTENPGFSPGLPPLAQGQAQASPRLTWALLLRRMLQRAIKGLLAFRPGKEKAWLQARLDR